MFSSFSLCSFLHKTLSKRKTVHGAHSSAILCKSLYWSNSWETYQPWLLLGQCGSSQWIPHKVFSKSIHTLQIVWGVLHLPSLDKEIAYPLLFKCFFPCLICYLPHLLTWKRIFLTLVLIYIYSLSGCM